MSKMPAWNVPRMGAVRECSLAAGAEGTTTNGEVLGRFRRADLPASGSGRKSTSMALSRCTPRNLGRAGSGRGQAPAATACSGRLRHMSTPTAGVTRPWSVSSPREHTSTTCAECRCACARTILSPSRCARTCGAARSTMEPRRTASTATSSPKPTRTSVRGTHGGPVGPAMLPRHGDCSDGHASMADGWFQ